MTPLPHAKGTVWMIQDNYCLSVDKIFLLRQLSQQ